MIKLKKNLADITTFISPELYYRLSYFHNRGRWLHLKNPTNLSEFIISQIVSGKTNDYAIYADKYRVRDFVTERGLAYILPKLYGNWIDANDINFDALPNQFVLKQNAGCGLNIICFDKAKLNIQETINKLNEWMQIKTFFRAEPHYDLIEKCIIAEELIQDEYYDLPTDYKFMCINGILHHILVVIDRKEHTAPKKFAYSLEWEKLDLLTEKRHNEDLPRPKNLNKMTEYARVLSQGFDFVRVDLYDTGDKVYFGEMTFTPQGGLLRNHTMKALEEMWNLNKL